MNDVDHERRLGERFGAYADAGVRPVDRVATPRRRWRPAASFQADGGVGVPVLPRWLRPALIGMGLRRRRRSDAPRRSPIVPRTRSAFFDAIAPDDSLIAVGSWLGDDAGEPLPVGTPTLLLDTDTGLASAIGTSTGAWPAGFVASAVAEQLRP